MTTKRQQQMNGPTNNNIEWIPRGLQNLGNTCFYNSTLQCLIATQPLADYIDQIQRQRFNGDGRVIVPKSYTVKIGERKVVVAKQEISLPAFGSQIQMPLFPAFRKFMEEANNKNGRGPSPAPLFQQISRKVPRFRGWNQQDAHELLRYLMDNLRQDEINHFENAFQLGDQEDNGPEQKKQTEERKLQCKALLEGPARPVLDAVFGGKLQQTVHCTRCHHVSVSTEPFFDISLPLHYNTQIQQQKAATKRRTTAIGNSSSLTKMEGEKQRASISERHSNKPQRVKSTTELPKMDDAQSQVQAPMIHNKHQREQKKREKKKRAREAKRLHKIGKQRSTTSDLGVTGTQQNDEDEEGKNGEDEEAANGNEQDNGQNGDEEKVTTQTTDETNSSTDVLLSGQSEGKIEDTNEMEDVQRNGQIPLENGRHNLEENGTGGDDEDDQQEEDPDIESVVRALNVYFDEANVEECSANQPSQKSVVGALRAFTWPEELAPDDNGYQCSKCGQKAKKEGKKVPPPATAFKRYLIMTPPLILTLHLKRFEQTGPRSTKKLNVHVQFPLLLDLAPFCSDKVKRIHQGQKNLLYSLYGVVCHSGGLSGGHYIAYVRARQPMDSKQMASFFQQANSHGNQTPTDEAEELERKLRQLAMTTENGHSTGKGHKTDKEAELVETIRKGHAEQCQHKSEWYYCSDSSVRKSSESEVLRSQAYLLFYERIY